MIFNVRGFFLKKSKPTWAIKMGMSFKLTSRCLLSSDTKGNSGAHQVKTTYRKKIMSRINSCSSVYIYALKPVRNAESVGVWMILCLRNPSLSVK